MSSDDTIRNSEDYKRTKQVFDVLFTNARIQTKEDFLSATGILPTRYLSFKENCRSFSERWERARKVSDILRYMKAEVDYHDDKVKSMSKMLAYLGLVESLGVAILDMALIFLIANGMEVHTRGVPSKHVETFKELEQLWDLDYKMQLLEPVGRSRPEAEGQLSIFKEKVINRYLRNTIAHLNFAIGDDGTIRDRDNNTINIDAQIMRFWEGIDTLRLVLEDIGFFKWLQEAPIDRAPHQATVDDPHQEP